MEKIKMESTKSIVRDVQGRFVEGNKEGKKFQKGYAGKPKGVRNKKTVIARQFAEDVLHINPETGDKMSYKELCLYIRKKADQSPRILNLLLDHYLGKPVERVQQEQRVFVITEPALQEEAQDAEVIEGEQRYLIEGE